MEAKKFGVAAGIGGALFCIFALVFVPSHHVFGLIASIVVGMAGGYLSYEFRDVLRAIPIALRLAWKGTEYVGRGALNFVLRILVSIKDHFAEPHPLFFQSLVLGAMIFIPFQIWLMPVDAAHPVLAITMSALFLAEAAFFGGIIIGAIAALGAQSAERKYWLLGEGLTGDAWQSALRRVEKLKSLGLTEAPLTHANLFRWQVKGMLVIIRFLSWTVWKYLAIGVAVGLAYVAISVFRASRFLPGFIIELLRLIHSQKRLVCAIYGTTGGIVNYYSFVSVSHTFAEKAMLVLCGGIFGAALGTAGREFVAKRVFRIPATEDRHNDE
jgi:hypothetical protein